jgi:hypothetical protein
MYVYKEQLDINAEARATNPKTEADWLHYFKSS